MIDLSFSELRLATMLRLKYATNEEPDSAAALGVRGVTPGVVSQILADMVIQIDKLAALHDISLAAAIRARFENVT